MSLVQKLSGVCWTFTFISLAWLQMSVAVQRRTGCIVPKFRFKPRNVQFGAEGDNVKLRCRIARWSMGTEYFWLKNGKPISTVYVSEQQKIRVKKMRYLMIRRTTVQDNGKYTCVTRNSCGTLNATTELVIRRIGPPRIIVNAQRRERTSIAVPVGNSIKMDCSASGYPRPTVKWYKNRRLYTHSVDGLLFLSPYQYVLGLRNVVPDDSGVYTCNVSNAYGWFNLSYKVDVRERVRAKPVLQKMENVTAIEGTNATIICRAISDSMPHFQWIRWFLPTLNTTSNTTTQAYEVVKPPRRTILSKRNGKFTFHGVKLLTLVNVTKSEQGKYTCLVGNAVGYNIEHVYLKVVTPEVPSQTPKPTSIQQKPEPPRRLDRTLIIVPIGNLIRMDCSASGYPRPTIKWYKNGRPYNARSVHDPVYSSSYQYVLSIMTASPDDSGVYTCNVSNAHGWFKHTFKVKVKDRMRSKPVVQTMNNVTALVGTRVIIICKARSDSIPHFQWLHWFMPNAAYSNIAKQSGYEIVKQTSSRYYQRIRMAPQNGKRALYGVKLIIENVTKSQQGKYSCLAGNDIGYGVQHTYVDVHHK